jgi:hypothetical protein
MKNKEKKGGNFDEEKKKAFLKKKTITEKICKFINYHDRLISSFLYIVLLSLL